MDSTLIIPKVTKLLSWIKKIKLEKKNGLIYGDTYVGKTYTANLFRENDRHQESILLRCSSASSYKGALTWLYYEIARLLSLENRYSASNYNTQIIEKEFLKIITEHNFKLLFLDEITNLKPKYYKRIFELINDAGISIIAIEYTPKIIWHLKNKSEYTEKIDDKFELTKLNKEENFQVLEKWNDLNPSCQIDKCEFQNIAYYNEGFIGTLIRNIARSRHYYLEKEKAFTELLLHKSRKAFEQFNQTSFKISDKKIAEFNNRDEALVMTILESNEASLIGEIAYKYSPGKIIEESPERIVGYTQYRNRLINTFGLYAREIASMAHWFKEDQYTKFGTRIPDTQKALALIKKLKNRGYIDARKGKKGYRYFTAKNASVFKRFEEELKE